MENPFECFVRRVCLGGRQNKIGIFLTNLGFACIERDLEKFGSFVHLE